MDINRLMASQHGVVSLAQARAAGLSPKQIRVRVARGEWERPHRAVYRATASPPSWHSELLAAVLAVNGVASHRCAAALWGLSSWRTPKLEVLVPERRKSTIDAIVHRTTQWNRIDRTVRSAIPVTGIDRTIIDLGAVVGLRRLELAAESALRQDLTSWPNLRACLIRHSRQGRNGAGRLRRLLELRYGDDALPLSEWSRLVRNLLCDRGLPEPVLEHRIHDSHGDVIAQVDLAWPECKVALELDSVRWHLNRASFERDRGKRNRLRAQGWAIHEATWTMTADDPDGLAAILRSSLLPATV